MLKFAIGVAVGAGIGATATYFIVKKKFEQYAQDEINTMKADILKKVEEKYGPSMVEQEGEAIEPTKEEPEEKPETIFHIDMSKPSLDKMAKDIINYSGYSKNGTDEEPKRRMKKHIDYDDEFEDEDEEDDFSNYQESGPSEGPADRPYVITPEAFANEYPYYDKITLRYFDKDKILVNEEDIPVTDMENEMLGEGYAHEFGTYEADLAYFRNEKSGTDYEVYCEHGSFKELVLGE